MFRRAESHLIEIISSFFFTLESLRSKEMCEYFSSSEESKEGFCRMGDSTISSVFFGEVSLSRVPVSGIGNFKVF